MDDDHCFMAAEADAAREHIEVLPHAMAMFDLGAPAPRARIAIQLARASIDFGRGSALLMANGFRDFGAPAISLHRMQMEQLLRSAFFCGPATDDEVAYFIKHDRIRNRPQGDDRQRAMTMNELAAIVEPFLDQDDGEGADDKLVRVVKGSYGTLSALVHGGHALLNAYGGNGKEVGFDISREGACQILDHLVAFANFSLAIVARTAVDPPERIHEILKPSFESFEGWTERMKHRKA